MKYDDAETCFLNFETELDNGAANTHIGMYLAWAVLAGLGRDDPGDAMWSASVAALKQRSSTGGQVLSSFSDCKLMDSEFSAEGKAFTAAYYDEAYVRDYQKVFQDQMPRTGHETDDFCRVPDTWANFDRLKPVLDRRYAAWKASLGPAAAPPSGPRELSLKPLDGAAPAPAATPAPAADAPTVEQLQQRAQAGDAVAWYELGAEYITGRRVPRDPTKAANAFEKAAQAGIPEAAFNLGVCYQNGDGRPQDPAQKLRWFALAAEGVHGQAAYFLAMAYREGEQVPQDFVASNALMLLAQSLGVEAAHKAGLMAGSIAESTALAEQLRKPGQLVSVLSARRRAVAAGRADSGVERWKNPGGRPDAGRGRAAPAAEEEADTGPGAAHAFGLGHLALWVGAAGLFVLLQGAITGARFKLYALVFALIGAGGVFAVGSSLGLSEAMRMLLTLLAAVPVFGSFVSLGVAVRWLMMRRRGG